MAIRVLANRPRLSRVAKRRCEPHRYWVSKPELCACCLATVRGTRYSVAAKCLPRIRESVRGCLVCRECLRPTARMSGTANWRQPKFNSCGRTIPTFLVVMYTKSRRCFQAPAGVGAAKWPRGPLKKNRAAHQRDGQSGNSIVFNLRAAPGSPARSALSLLQG
jgi:hypothetical protein